MNANWEQEQEPLPLLPRFRMIWFFIVAAIVAVGVMIVQSVEEGRHWMGAIAYSFLFLLCFFGLGSFFFFIAYFFGAIDRAVAAAEPKPDSPFSDAGLPPQLIPPRPSNDNS